jgi:D-alanyl-lipoteichoic acid acyltransferase DltB (MBOAT superfamily)
MLFHSWPFLIFALVVLPTFFALRRTPLWLPWLMAASYFFYGWWNPYYLLLVVYSTALDYLLVTLMDRCPLDSNGPDGTAVSQAARDPVMTFAGVLAGALALGLVVGAVAGPATLRPTGFAFAVLVTLMAWGALWRSRKMWLLISVVNNLALLLFFKYARFVVENLNGIVDLVGGTWRLADPSTLMPYGSAYVLPVGISFFTFQSMSYTIDFYLGKVERERNFLRFSTFVCFFPQLMAGPIERAKHLLPQFRQAPPFCWENLSDGLSLFLVGLFKKLALADYLAQYVDRVYGSADSADALALIVATVAFAWQIYFDFSGYTDMARGLARMMGFQLILNFNHPYLAIGLGDFWSRWHISLSSWFRDYVYIPLGGNRGGTWATYRNLLITFLVSGVWHGANWTFAIWGLLHACGVMLTRELERSAFYRHRVPRLFKQAGVFAYVSFAWIFFRATSLEQARVVIERIARGAFSDPGVPLLMLLLIGVIWIYQQLCESRFRGLLGAAPIRVTFAVGMILYLCLCSSGGGTFIYFQF